MSLKPCRECKREISSEARTCPHCGKKDPTGRPTSPLALGCLFLILVGGIGSLLSSSNADRSSQLASPNGSTADLGAPVSTPLAPITPGSEWDYSHDKDEMTGKVAHTAMVTSQNTVEFGFPYEGPQHATLMIRRHPRFGSDVIFSIERGQLLCPSYDGCSVAVRFDEGDPTSFSANAPADHSTETIFITNYDRFVSKMRAAKTVRISPAVYQQGNVVFTFDVSGFDVQKLRGQ